MGKKGQKGGVYGNRDLAWPEQPKPQAKGRDEGALIGFLRRQGHHVKRKRGVLTVTPKVRPDD